MKLSIIIFSLMVNLCYSQINLGKEHNELLEFMEKNYSVEKFDKIDEYISIQYDFLSEKYPDLKKTEKQEFINLVLLNFNSNIISDYDYKKSNLKTLEKVYGEKKISSNFYSSFKKIIDDEIELEKIDEFIINLKTENDLEKKAILDFQNISKHSKEYWNSNHGHSDVRNNNFLHSRESWLVDTLTGVLGGLLFGTVNPFLGAFVSIAASEFASAACNC